MSARSSLHSVLVLAVAACSSKKGPPEADPAEVKARAQLMIKNTPAPVAAPNCTVEQLNAPGVTARSLILLAENEVPTTPERLEWINPSELDDPSVRAFLEAKDDDAKRQAAAAVLAHKAWLVVRSEMIDVPLAIGVKELKRGAVGMRAIGYDGAGNVTCITVFSFKNDKAVSEWAMEQSDKAEVDPAIAKALQQDLKTRLVAKVAAIRSGDAP